MGRIARCAQARRSKKPLYIEKADLKIYTSEELAFYIRKNLSSIDRDFFNQDLFIFLEQELKEEKLSKSMRAKAKGSDILSLAETLVLAVGDLNKREADALRHAVDGLRSMSPAGRRKMDADALFDAGRLEAACQIYMDLLSDGKGLSDQEKGEINLCLARIYAACFAFTQAGGFYTNAYEYLKQTEILHELYDLCRAAGEDTDASGIFLPLSDSQLAAWDQEFERKRENALHDYELSGPRDLAGMDELVREWQEDFRKIHKSCCQKPVFSV